MTSRAVPFLVLALALAARADESKEKIEFRVTARMPGGAVTIDRGERDGLAVGDRVTLRDRLGAGFPATVTHVDDRSATVEIDEKTFEPPPGTRGEALIPRARFDVEKEAPQPEPEPAQPDGETDEPAPDGEPEDPKWTNPDEEWTPDKPLLDRVQPLRPEDRPRQVFGRAYLTAVISDYVNDSQNSIYRAGGDVDVLNPFGRGGKLSFDAEMGYLTEHDGSDGLDLLLRRASYSWGGTRFSPMRWEVGRFLHDGMPEFGVLDGAEWSERRDNGHRYGFSVGFLPELDEDFETGRDLQAAGYYRWTSGPEEHLVLSAGFQKTWHNSNADRDLLILKARYLPVSGWDLSASILIDFYTSGDAGKPFAEVTQALVTARRAFASGNGYIFAFRHLAYPLIDRVEFLPVLANEVLDNRYDRLSFEGWRYVTEHLRVRAYVAGFNDEEFTGGAAELSVQTEDLLVPDSRADLTVFADRGQFATTIGARASYGRWVEKGRWMLLYEISNHHQYDFPQDVNDVVQHRARIDGAYYFAADWDLTGYFEVQLYDSALSWALGITLQKRF